MMMREERAKQFLPFDAMKGLQDALRDREEHHSRVERHDISEEQMERNSEVFARLRRGMEVRLDCYRAFHDVTLRGRVTEVSIPFRHLKLGEDAIPFADVYSIEITEEA